jgi:hypothetical protein
MGIQSGARLRRKRAIEQESQLGGIVKTVVKWAFVIAFCLAVGLSGQTATAPAFTLTIRAEQPAVEAASGGYPVKAGSDVFISVHLTNVSKHKLSVGYDVNSRTGVAFGDEYEVRDSNGNLLPKRPINHPEIGATGHGWPERIVDPGQSTDITGDRITGVYDLSQPGSYTIQLLRSTSADAKDSAVRSNKITVTVEP